MLDQQQIDKIQKGMLNPWMFRWMMLRVLPMGFLAGVSVKELTADRCCTTVKYKWLNKNPFHSLFWAVLGMAAEMASGALMLMYGQDQPDSVAFILTEMSGKFGKKALGRISFVCQDGLKIRAAFEETIRTGEAVVIVCPVRAENEEGVVVAEFTFTWSMKKRSQR